MPAARTRRDDRPTLGLQAARTFMGTVERIFDLFGLDDAADNLRRYRSGQGGERFYSDDEIAEHALITEAENEARTRFESQTFTGRTGHKVLNQRLLGLRNGEEYEFPDSWDRNYGLSAVLRPATYAAFGRFGVESRGDFKARRRGNRLYVTGTVTHDFDRTDAEGRPSDDNLFDFNPRQPGHREGSILERAGEAAPFRMRFDRKQDVDAELVYESSDEPNGRRLTLKRATWGEIR